MLWGMLTYLLLSLTCWQVEVLTGSVPQTPSVDNKSKWETPPPPVLGPAPSSGRVFLEAIILGMGKEVLCSPPAHSPYSFHQVQLWTSSAHAYIVTEEKRAFVTEVLITLTNYRTICVRAPCFGREPS